MRHPQIARRLLYGLDRTAIGGRSQRPCEERGGDEGDEHAAREQESQSRAGADSAPLRRGQCAQMTEKCEERIPAAQCKQGRNDSRIPSDPGDSNS